MKIANQSTNVKTENYQNYDKRQMDLEKAGRL